MKNSHLAVLINPQRRKLLFAGSLAATAATVGMTGCGGGGDSDPDNTVTPPESQAEAFKINSAPLTAAPFCDVTVVVPPVSGGTYGGRWILSDSVDIPATFKPVSGGTSMVVLAPAGVFDNDWLGRAGDVRLELTRTLNGAPQTASATIAITEMPFSIYKPGTIALLVARLSQSIINKASGILLNPTSAALYQKNIAYSYGDGSPPAMIGMSDEELRVLDRVLLSWLLALGIDITTSPQFKILAFTGAVDTDISVFGDLAAIRNALAEKARDSAGKLITAGGIAIVVGATLAAGSALAAPLIVGGAIAMGTGLMFGMAEGFVMDNAINFAGNGTTRQIEWANTAKFYATNIVSNFTADLLSKNFGSGELLAGQGKRLYGFAVDTAHSFIADEIADQIATTTSQLIGIAKDISVLSPLVFNCRSPELVSQPGDPVDPRPICKPGEPGY